MRDQYHEDLDALTDQLVEMTRLVGGALDRATQALLDADIALADQVIQADTQIDVLHANIEDRAFELLARQQPVASDLRIIVTALRMTADLERAGDYATHIAELARRRYPHSAIRPNLRATVLEMSQVAQKIVVKVGQRGRRPG
jgi:phosphate transport system protein